MNKKIIDALDTSNYITRNFENPSSKRAGNKLIPKLRQHMY
jgi:hypothetical protein